MNDRSSPETKLNISTDATKLLWLREFGVPYAVPGGMFRGPPPRSFWDPSWLAARHTTTRDAEAAAATSKATSVGRLLAAALAHKPFTGKAGGKAGGKKSKKGGKGKKGKNGKAVAKAAAMVGGAPGTLVDDVVTDVTVVTPATTRMQVHPSRSSFPCAVLTWISLSG